MVVGISGYVGNRLTGIGRVLVNVVRELAVQYPGDVYYIFKNDDYDGFKQLEGIDNVRFVNTGVSKESGVGNLLWHQWGFQRMLKKYSCNLAYIPNFSLLLWKAVPTVVTIHDLIEFNVPGKFGRMRMFYRKIICDPLMAKRSDVILTVSESSKRDIIKYLKAPASKITVTPNASDDSVFRKFPAEECAEAAARYNLGFKDYFLFVGTIDYPGKNIKSVIEAYVGLREDGLFADKKLVIIGKKGHNAEVIMSIVESSAFKDDIVFLGYVPDADLGKLCGGALLMLYVSHYEGFGLPVLEAMSCGTPAICSNTSSLPEIAGDLDMCVPPEDIDAIKRKVVEFADPAGYEALSEAMYKRSRFFSWAGSARIYHRVFESQI
ncbi:MAG: glycosyltransferase family 4 protein [Bacteroidales bacterium]|nr:glycosyltransferase family 4 protein [Bacteroidales bacterium]MBR0083266.1 glycosyltransferase family 4 protein [Bacteroidales bacterium]